MKTSLICCIAIACSGYCSAQSDGVASDTTEQKSTLTLGAVYASNANYYGERAIESTPYAAIASTYRLRSGLYFSGLMYKLLHEKTSTVSAGALGVGVNLRLGKHFTGDLSYSHSFYPGNSPLLQAANPDNASASLTFESAVNVSVTGDYAFGKTSDAFLTTAISHRFNLFSLGKKDIVTLNPSLDLVAGTQHFYTTYLTEKKIRDSLLGSLLPPFTGNQNETETKTKSTTSFNPISYNLKCPLAYNRASYLVEAAYQLSVLGNAAQNGQNKTNSFFTVSFYYQL